MDYRRGAPRRVPQWVRDLSNSQAHATAFWLRRCNTTTDLSEQQWWLFDQLVCELEYRASMLPWLAQCRCELCRGPFPTRQADNELNFPYR